MNAQTPPLSDDEIGQLADEIAEASAYIDAATHRLLTGIRRFDEAEGWGAQGALSCAHWLSWRVGLGLGVAREKVRVARRLGELALVDRALSRGEISYSKVRAITRVATADNEATLLEMARCSTAAQLEKICRLYRRVGKEPADDIETADNRRWLYVEHTDDRMVRITASLHSDEAARVLSAVDASAETSSKRGCDRADGLVALAEAALDGGGDRPVVEATVRVDVDAATMTGELEEGSGISAETSRRLLCDCGVVPVAEDQHGNPLALGRKRRSVSTALRRALRLRDRGCRFPGCTNHRFVDAHHIDHRADGGETSLANTVLLCRRHHRFVHEFAFTASKLGEGELGFFDPEGRQIPESGELGLARLVSAERFHAALAARDPGISAERNQPQWDGLPVNYGLVIDCLAAVDSP